MLSDAFRMLFLLFKHALVFVEPGESVEGWSKPAQSVGREVIITVLCVHTSFCFTWCEYIETNAITCHSENLVKNIANSFGLHTTKHKNHGKLVAEPRVYPLCGWRLQSWALRSQIPVPHTELPHPHRAEHRKASVLTWTVSFRRQFGNIS